MTIGMLQFEENLDRARLLDAERYAKDHNAQRLEVEHAMIVTLKKNGQRKSSVTLHAPRPLPSQAQVMLRVASSRGRRAI